MMFRNVVMVLVSSLAIGAGPALAQETAGPGKVELSVIPGGAVYFSQSDATKEASFFNYDLGGALTVNFRRVAIEGEVGGSLGLSQTLNFASSSLNSTRTPDTVSYSGNVIVPLMSRSSVVPYVTGGVGGLTLLEKPEVGLASADTFLTGNVGGGVKWYAGRWGLRADYRFLAVKSKDEASSFFGRDDRYGHRVYGGIIVNLVP
ncbi:MAG: hypothetical protein ABL993_03285 [Vicinamibacterales bacterium]